MSQPTPTDNGTHPLRLADFSTLPEALDYAAQGQTGLNFYSARGKLTASLPYADLSARAKDAARHFLGSGVRRGDRVALLAETAPAFLIGFFACQYAGAIPVPMPTPVAFGRREAYVDQIGNQIRSSGAVMVIAPKDFIPFVEEAAENLTLKMIGTLDDLLAMPTRDDLSPGRSEELCYIQYISGSTRFPKGVAVTHANLMANCSAMVHAVGISTKDRGVSWLPFYHDMGLVGFMIGCMTSQMSVDYLPTEEFVRRPVTWLRILSENGSTVSYSPSFGYELCARRFSSATTTVADLDLSSWRIAGIGGEMIKPQVMKAFADVFAPSGFSETAFNASYGLAECVLGVCFSQPGTGMVMDHISKQEMGDHHRAVSIADDGSGAGRTFVACGAVIDGHTVEIRDEDGTVMGERAVGRVFVSGPSIMQGYYGDPDATAECLIDGWLDTGDLGYFHGDQLVIVGRAKDMMIVNDRNYWPQDIEWTVEHIDGMRSGDAAAFTLDADDGSEQPTILVQCRRSDPDTRSSLVSQVRSRVQDQVGLTCDIILVPPRSLPKTSSGKLARGKAKMSFLSGEIEPLVMQT